MQSVLKHVQLKPSSLNSAELLNDLLKWITAFYLQINDDANSGPIKLNLDIRDGSIVVCVPGRFKNLGSIENGILDPQMWRLHTMTVSNSPPSLRYTPKIEYNVIGPSVDITTMKEGHKFVPPHAAIIFQMPEKGHDFMRCYYAATSGLRFQGFMAFFVETHAAYNPQEIRPDLERPQWTIPMVHRNSSGDPLSARQLSKSSFKEITSAAATDLLCPVVLRHLVVPTKASGPYTNAIIVAGTHRLSLYTYWRWSSFQPYTRPLKRTKAFFYINGTLAPDVLEDLDLPRAFWSLGLLVFASIYNSGLPANDGTLHTHDNRHFAQIVFSIIDKVSEYRPIRPVWIISRDIIPFMYLAEISLLDDAAVTWLIERRLQTVGRVPDFLVQVYLKNGKLLTLEEMSMMSMVGPADVEKVVVRVLGNCRSMSERQAIFNWKPAAPGVRRV